MQNKSQVGGVLSIISGVFGILGFFLFAGLIVFFGFLARTGEFGLGPGEREVFTFVGVMYGILGLGCLALGIVGLIGGVYALKRRHWGWALAGAICGVLTFLPTGIIATIFVAQAQNEFGPQTPVAGGTPVVPPPQP